MSERSGKSSDAAAPAAGAGQPTGVDPDRRATYREVFAVREFRALYASGTLSSVGDYLGRVALVALIYQATGSAVYSAAGLAITYLPWLAGAPFLVALAERYPRRRVMLASDIGRLVLVSAAAIPELPLPLLPVLMFLAALISPPFDASRSALLPTVLSGDRYVLGMSVTMLTGQAAQVAGYLFGGVLIGVIDPHAALGVDAATFGLSALLIATAVHPRPAVVRAGVPRNLIRETAQGFTVVFGNKVLRAMAIVILSGVAFMVLPEGLSAAWSGALHKGTVGQGMIMAAGPVGVVVGGIVVGRLMKPSMRRRLIRPLAVLVPLGLIGALFNPPLPVVLVLTAVTGFAMSLILPANALFVQALPNSHRARAFGVMQGGLQVVQGGVMVGGGLLAKYFGVAHGVGLWAVVGLIVMVSVSALWPKQSAFDEAIATAQAANAAAEQPAAEPTPPAPATPAEPAEAETEASRPGRAGRSAAADRAGTADRTAVDLVDEPRLAEQI